MWHRQYTLRYDFDSFFVSFTYSRTSEVCLKAAGIDAVCGDDTDIALFGPQDLHLHKFFQHCQLMRTTSEDNQAELIKYLKVKCCSCTVTVSLTVASDHVVELMVHNYSLP